MLMFSFFTVFIMSSWNSGSWKSSEAKYNSMINTNNSKYKPLYNLNSAYNSPGNHNNSPGNRFGPVGSPNMPHSQESWSQSPGGSSLNSPASSYGSPASASGCYGHQVRGHPGCTLCYQNKELKAVYMSHSLKDTQGKVTCPVLYANVCPYCKATGPDAHTKNYCPYNPQQHSFKSYLKYRNASGGSYDNQSSKGKY